MFTVIEASSAYNIILGHLTLSSFQVIASPYHQKIKFLVWNEVGEVRGDQQAACKCYVEMIQMDQKKVVGWSLLNRQGGSTHDVYAMQEESPLAPKQEIGLVQVVPS